MGPVSGDCLLGIADLAGLVDGESRNAGGCEYGQLAGGGENWHNACRCWWPARLARVNGPEYWRLPVVG